MDWSYVRMYQQWINREKYEVHRYFVPCRLKGRIKFLRKYFRVMDRDVIPYQYKRRKNPIEYLETALMILGRMDSLCTSDIPIVAGSGFLSPKPWAIFGEIPEKDAISPRVTFRDFDDIANFYKPLIVNGGHTTDYFRFRLCPALSWVLADKHFLTPHYVVAAAICLLYDIIMNCGPDCEEFYDVFTNDTRVGSKSVDIEEWQNLRCKVMGKNGHIRDKRWPVRLGQFYEPTVSLISTLRFHEVPDSDNLAEGEKVKIFKVMPKTEACLCGEGDEKTESPETDVSYQNRVKEKLDKYSHLGIIRPTAWCQ